MRAALYIPLLMLLATGCAAPKDSHKSFPRPKYELRPNARNGTPAVTQRWWSRGWFWQPTTARKRKPKTIRLK